MLSKLLAFIRTYDMVQPGDHVVCALSGGADSVALVYAMKLLQQKLEITVSAAHFNHRLRGEESDRDEQFVRSFCQRHDIDLAVGAGAVKPEKKGLEAAARNARYAFLNTLPGKLATAHTADDNAETVLMHLVRGTGLKGLGGIAPVRGALIRPMLGITREEVLAFLQEYSIPYVNDSSNSTDVFLRNRLRHGAFPLLRQENPKLAENLSAMALRMREEEALLDALAQEKQTQDIHQLRQMPQALRGRVLRNLMQQWGVPEPEGSHVALAEKLIFSRKPSASAAFPGGVTLTRSYDTLEKKSAGQTLQARQLPCPGTLEIPELALRIVCSVTDRPCNETNTFTVKPVGEMYIRSRAPGDTLRRKSGSKSLKALFIDRKIPAALRKCIPVLSDECGILGVYGFGADQDRLADTFPAVCISFEPL